MLERADCPAAAAAACGRESAAGSHSPAPARSGARRARCRLRSSTRDVRDLGIGADAVEHLLERRSCRTCRAPYSASSAITPISDAPCALSCCSSSRQRCVKSNAVTATAVRKMRPIVSRLSLVSRPMRTGGRSSIDTVSAPSGDRCLRSARRTYLHSYTLSTAQHVSASHLMRSCSAERALTTTRVRGGVRQRRLRAGQLPQRERCAVAAEVRVVPVDRVQRARAHPCLGRPGQRNVVAEREQQQRPRMLAREDRRVGNGVQHVDAVGESGQGIRKRGRSGHRFEHRNVARTRQRRRAVRGPPFVLRRVEQYANVVRVGQQPLQPGDVRVDRDVERHDLGPRRGRGSSPPMTMQLTTAVAGPRARPASSRARRA